MANTGITDLQEALGNPKRPDFASLPDPMREMLSKKKQTRKETKILNKRIELLKQKEQEQGSKPKRAKIELTHSLLRQENAPPLDWVCPRDQAENAIRDKFISVRLILTISQASLTSSQGELQGIDSWSAPAYAYPTEWSTKTRDAWRKGDMVFVSEFEHKSTPHPNEPKDVTVTDEEMEALVKQFTGLKIEVLEKIYWHQYPDGRLEAIHPRLVRVRKDGTFFMYDDDELKGGPKLTRPGRCESASHPLTVDQMGTSTSDPIIVNDHGSSVQEPIVLDMDKTEAPTASSAPPRATHPIVIVSIPPATRDEMEMSSRVKVKGASEGKGKRGVTSFAIPTPSPPPVGDATLANELDMFIARHCLPPSPYPHENVQSSLPPGIFDVPEPGTLPAEYPPANSAPSEVPGIYPVHTDQLPTLDGELPEIIGGVDMCNVPQVQILPADSAPPEVLVIDPVHTDQAPTLLDEQLAPFFESMTTPFFECVTTYSPQVQLLPLNFAPSEVPVIDPVACDQQRTLDELTEFFESVNTYHVPQVQILPQIDSDWNTVFAPTAATVYQHIPEISAKEWTRWDGLGPPSCRLQHWKSLPQYVSSLCSYYMQR